MPSPPCPKMSPNVPNHRFHFARTRRGAPRRTIHRAHGKTNPPRLPILGVLGVLAFRLSIPRSKSAERSHVPSCPTRPNPPEPATICPNPPPRAPPAKRIHHSWSPWRLGG